MMNKNVILLVEDDPDTCNAMCDLLELEFPDCQVVMACNGAEGLKAFKKHKGNILFVLSDQYMPIMGGKEFTQNIRIADPRVLIFMASADQISAETRSPLNGCFKKPPEASSMFKTIRDEIAKQG